MDNLIKRVTRLEGKRGCAFVLPGMLGVTKALRVMGHMEKQGVIVEDFGALSGVRRSWPSPTLKALTLG